MRTLTTAVLLGSIGLSQAGCGASSARKASTRTRSTSRSSIAERARKGRVGYGSSTVARTQSSFSPFVSSRSSPKTSCVWRRPATFPFDGKPFAAFA